MIKLNQEMYALLIKSLIKEDQTASSLMDITGLHRVTIQSFMRICRKHKIIHISDWEPDVMGRDAYHVYRFGGGKDKPRYKVSAKERTRKYRAAKADPTFPTSTLQAFNGLR